MRLVNEQCYQSHEQDANSWHECCGYEVHGFPHQCYLALNERIVLISFQFDFSDGELVKFVWAFVSRLSRNKSNIVSGKLRQLQVYGAILGVKWIVL